MNESTDGDLAPEHPVIEPEEASAATESEDEVKEMASEADAEPSDKKAS